MKSVGIVFCLLALLAGPDQRLVGIWESSEDEDEYMEFRSNGYAFIYFDGDTIGGKRFFSDDFEEYLSLSYETKGNGDTLMLDLVLKNADDQEEVSRAMGWYTIRRDSLILSIDEFDSPRPESMDDLDNYLFIRRKNR